MDPFTAVSMVGNLLQFIAAARTICKQVAEIRSSVTGLTQKNKDMLASAAELSGIAEEMSAEMQSFPGIVTPTEERIRNVGLRCQQLGKEIEEEIRAKASKGQSNVIIIAATVIKSTWASSEVDKKLRELNDLQNTLIKLALAHISRQQAGLDVAVTDLLDQNWRLEMNRAEELRQLRREIMTVSQSLQSLLEAKSPEVRAEDTASRLQVWVEQAACLKREQRIIESLRFDGMWHRRNEIHVARKNTFTWVFEPRLHFKEWLETGEGVYWVSGDPGSGKSTLIKYISSHNATQEALSKWAGDKTLITAKFFFWFSGTTLQKSQEGLLRSLLFEIFRQCPSAIGATCCSKWRSDLAPSWDRDELMAIIENLCLQMTSTRFCFFIDGLDEYQGEPGVKNGDDVPSHVSEIICAMEKLSKIADIKLCVSSRPWRAFEKAFGQLSHRKLYVNNENRNDIRSYIRDRLELNGIFPKSSYNYKEIQGLVDEIVADSRGVFIWVFLVVESLLRGLSNEDRVGELRRRVNETPKSLNELFERMLNSVEDIYQEQAAQILQIALHTATPMYVGVYSFIGDDEYNVFEAETRPWTTEECLSTSKTTEARISVRCPDLIKIRTPSSTPTTTEEMTAHQVDFLHRTVRDFLALEDTQKRLNQRMREPFDPGHFICNGLLALIKGASASRDDCWSNIDEHFALWRLFCDLCAQAAELEEKTGEAQIKLLDELERAIAHQAGRNDFLICSYSFLGTMVRKELYRYVDAKLPDGLNCHGPSLLTCALGGYVNSPPLPKMVSLLLSHGASADEVEADTGKSVWYNYMRRLCQPHYAEYMKEVRTAHLAIIRDLLEHGADPRLQCDLGRTKIAGERASGVRYSVQDDLLEMIQYISQPVERELLVALVKERRKASSSDQGLLGWLGWK